LGFTAVRHQLEKPLKIRQTKTKTTKQQQQQTKQREKEYKCQHTLNSRSSGALAGKVEEQQDHFLFDRSGSKLKFVKCDFVSTFSPEGGHSAS